MQGTLEFLAGFFSHDGEKRIALDIACVWMLLCIAAVGVAQYSLLAAFSTPFIAWLWARWWARKALRK